MKLLIVSDIHGQLEVLEKIIKNHPDCTDIVCAGDIGLDIKTVERLNMIAVRGNGDYYSNLPLIRYFDIDNKKIMLTHGHVEQVKYGLFSLKQKALLHKVDICIFGHTHDAYVENDNNILYINPGAISDLYHNYAIYENGDVTFYEYRK